MKMLGLEDLLQESNPMYSQRAMVHLSSIHCDFFLGHAHSMWIFPGQGLNQYHSSNPSHNTDYTRSPAYWVIKEFSAVAL